MQGSLASTLGAAALVWAVRLAAVYCGSWLGAWLGGTPPEHRRRVWYGMITQAGVAMGLAKAVAARFPDWGPDFVALMARAHVPIYSPGQYLPLQ